MKKSIFIGLLLACCTVLNAQVRRPKLVVGIVVDQMRWDYLYYYNNEFGEGGFKRLLREGRSCQNTMIPYIPTVTAIGHSSIYTGSVPALTGILGNDFFINGRPTYCCQDDSVQSVGSTTVEGKMSPRNLLASTIGDELKLATNFRAKVVGVALKDRAAILPAGHSADAAYWWDTRAGHFVSSTYYMQQLPAWVEQFNKTHKTAPGFDLKTNVKGIPMTFDMAEAALRNERLGQGNETDMLAISVSSTDAIGHKFSTRGQEIHDAYLQLDRDLTRFLNTLDATATTCFSSRPTTVVPTIPTLCAATRCPPEDLKHGRSPQSSTRLCKNNLQPAPNCCWVKTRCASISTTRPSKTRA